MNIIVRIEHVSVGLLVLMFHNITQENLGKLTCQVNFDLLLNISLFFENIYLNVETSFVTKEKADRKDRSLVEARKSETY